MSELEVGPPQRGIPEIRFHNRVVSDNRSELLLFDVRMPSQPVDLLERIRHCAMPVGTVECRATWLRQEGEMRFAPGRPWMPFKAEQWFRGDSIEFRWQAWVRMAPLLRARVIDAFEGGRGRLTALVFGLVPVANSRGAATDKGEAMRGLAELPWRPFAFRETPQLRWEITGADKLRATFDDGRTQAAVEFDVDHDGKVCGGGASSRPRTVGKSLVETAWSGAFRDYEMFDNVRVPTIAEVAWHLPEGPFTYWRARVTDFRVLR
jgi:hypothetical protein